MTDLSWQVNEEVSICELERQGLSILGKRRGQQSFVAQVTVAVGASLGQLRAQRAAAERMLAEASERRAKLESTMGPRAQKLSEMHRLGQSLVLTGNLHEAKQVLHTALAQAKFVVSIGRIWRLHDDLADVANANSEPIDNVTHATISRKLDAMLISPQGVARALSAYASIVLRCPDDERAFAQVAGTEMAMRASQVYVMLRMPYEAALAIIKAGIILERMPDLEESRSCWLRACDLFEAAGRSRLCVKVRKRIADMK